MYRGCVFTAAPPGSIPPWGPLLCVSPSLSPFSCPILQLSYQNKGAKASKIHLEEEEEEDASLLLSFHDLRWLFMFLGTKEDFSLRVATAVQASSMQLGWTTRPHSSSTLNWGQLKQQSSPESQHVDRASSVVTAAGRGCKIFLWARGNSYVRISVHFDRRGEYRAGPLSLCALEGSDSTCLRRLVVSPGSIFAVLFGDLVDLEGGK